MHHEVATAVRERLGLWSNAEPVTDRRETQVWRVRMVSGATVAVKIAIGDETGVLPIREAAVLHAAGPSAGVVLGAGAFDEGSWMASPWWSGPTLWDQFEEVRNNKATAALARRRAAGAAARAARAVADLHAAGWAHGDLQAAHVIDTTGGARLLDLAWAHGPQGALPEDLEIPYRGALVHLEAPEIARVLLDGEPTAPTVPADVYALGGALWSAWTDTWPVDYEAAGVDPAPGNPEEKRQTVASGQYRRTSEAHEHEWYALEALLQHAMALEPGDRPDARVLAEKLERVAAQSEVRP